MRKHALPENPAPAPPLDDAARVAAVRRHLRPWFNAHQRPLPWRTDYRPYAVWVAEIMLQQTQMERGVDYFNRWMRRFPDVAAVAHASEDEVLKYWEGLGYYSRARNLHKAAQAIMREHGGRFPRELAAIRALPGVGPYTAHAIASIAFGLRVACVDANVERVVTRLFDIDCPVRQEPAPRRIRELAERLLPAESAGHAGVRAHNQAMMELGALVCRKKPRCELCPLALACESRRLGIAHQRPVPGKKPPVTPVNAVTGVLRHGGRVFVQKRLDRDVWAGLWEFPGGRIEPGETPEEAIVREYAEETGFAVRVAQSHGVIKHNYTTFRITLHCFGLELAGLAGDCPSPPVLTAATDCRWLAPEGIAQLPMPAAHRKLADRLFSALGAEV